MEASITVDKAFRLAQVDSRLFGSFLEHIGRAIYGGIHEPTHSSANGDGFRRDVIELVHELSIPLVRYPGGNFVSSYDWRDGIGPVAKRPTRLNLAWGSIEPNTVGVDEFVKWARAVGADVMMAVNLGTAGVTEALELLEYCNHASGTFWSDERRANGAVAPHGIKLWCLGNEVDGSWQIGQKTATEYGRLANETAKAMKLYDPSLQLAACGSSNRHMPTFPQWEATVLEHCYDNVDFISLHTYYGNDSDDLETFLASSLDMDRFIETVISTCDFVGAKLRRSKRINLSFDEWNVWYHAPKDASRSVLWQLGNPQIEDTYTLEDALVVGCMLNSLIRHADRVKVACLAQLVNVIAPIMTVAGGPAWRQTIFYPFMFASRYGRGTVLQAQVSCRSYPNRTYGEVPYVDAAAVLSEAEDQLALFTVNRSREAQELVFYLGGLEHLRLEQHIVLRNSDPKAANTKENPNAVVPEAWSQPRGRKEAARVTLPSLSWNLLRFVGRESLRQEAKGSEGR